MEINQIKKFRKIKCRLRIPCLMRKGNVAPAPVRLNSKFSTGASGIEEALTFNGGKIATSVTIKSIEVIIILIGVTCSEIYLETAIIDYEKTISHY